ncbi:MAG: acyl-CoA dehydrogenase family protein [Sporichthyaceae bacterium]
MNLAFSADQETLRSEVRRFLDAHASIRRTRELAESPEGYDHKVWARMADELQLQALHVPEAYGGAGFSILELTVVLEEMGRVLLPGPFFSSACLATTCILEAATEQRKVELLPDIAAGLTVATLAFTEESGSWDAADLAMSATPHGDGFLLSGTKTFVPDGLHAGLVLVAARLDGTHGLDGLVLCTVAGDAPGLTRTALPTMDRTRRQARLDFDRVPALPLGEPGADWPALSAALDRAAVCLAAEQVGGAQRCLEMAVDYAKLRVQFGRPIGSFQAVKHRCADMLGWVEAAKSAAYFAAWTAADGSGDLPAVASVAKSYCSEAFFRTTAENIQVHGGVGFTWEHDAHLYYRRAKASEVLLGDPTFHRERLARLVIDA